MVRWFGLFVQYHAIRAIRLRRPYNTIRNGRRLQLLPMPIMRLRALTYLLARRVARGA